MYSIVYITGVIISSFAQVLLKKAADVNHNSKIREYLNFKTILAYSIFFGATLCSVIAYRYVPLSLGPILGTLEYFFVAFLGYILLKEKLSKKKILGLVVIMVGILLFII
ncbi:4-amino-4-deoxy-L-arabinose-phosphoundecaprenol flippase subunit ArnE [compost metagenome]